MKFKDFKDFFKDVATLKWFMVYAPEYVNYLGPNQQTESHNNSNPNSRSPLWPHIVEHLPDNGPATDSFLRRNCIARLQRSPRMETRSFPRSFEKLKIKQCVNVLSRGGGGGLQQTASPQRCDETRSVNPLVRIQANGLSKIKSGVNTGPRLQVRTSPPV